LRTMTMAITSRAVMPAVPSLLFKLKLIMFPVNWGVPASGNQARLERSPR
jgi:hypothetical protein